MPEHGRIAELLWDPPPQPSRGPKRSVSLARIVEAGIALADAEGLDALSMQRIAADVGLTKMALYRYVPGRTELVVLMADTALGPPPDLAKVRGGWRKQLRRWAIDVYAGAMLHPWIYDVFVGGRVLGPNELGWLEAGLEVLGGTALRGGERLDAMALLSGHVRNLVAQHIESETPESDLAAAMGTVLAARGAEFPETAAAFAATAVDGEADNALDFGLDRILDGLAVLIER